MRKIKNEWEKQTCNLCNNEKFEMIYDDATTWMNDGKYKVVRCTKCSLVYLSPRPKQEFIHKFYEPDSYWSIDLAESNTSDELKRRDKAYNFLYKDIFNMKEKGSILDVGAGTGLFLTKFKEKKWNVSGVELSKHACNFARKAYGIDLIQGDLLNIKLPRKKYDFITLNGCLEHLHEPKETLKKISKLLKNNGFVVISVPNFESIGSRIFRDKWFALQPPTHLYHFTPQTVSRMLKNSAFKDISIKHSYWEHNYYIIFESIRLNFSPKFKRSKEYFKNKKIAKKSRFSFKLELGKILAKGVSFTTAALEPILRKGEAITVYAKKA